MPTTFNLIASSVLGSPTSNIEFTNIPQTFTDLMMFFQVRGNASSSTIDNVNLQVNSHTSYSTTALLSNNSIGIGGSQSSGVTRVRIYPGGTGSNATANFFGGSWIYLANYVSTNARTLQFNAYADTIGNGTSTLLQGNSNTTNQAITSIRIDSATSSTWVAGSCAYLYGIKNS